MRCIKEKCKYCHEHDFRTSFLTCSLNGRSFKKDKEIQCAIEDKIESLVSKVDSMSKYVDFIKRGGNKVVDVYYTQCNKTTVGKSLR